MKEDLKQTLLDLLPRKRSNTAKSARLIYDAVTTNPSIVSYPDTNESGQSKTAEKVPVKYTYLTTPAGFLQMSSDNHQANTAVTIYAPDILTKRITVTITPTGERTAVPIVTHKDGKPSRLFPPRRVTRVLMRAVKNKI